MTACLSVAEHEVTRAERRTAHERAKGGALIVLPLALNHVTTPDLSCALFDGEHPVKAGQMAKGAGLEILALAEITSFNDWSDDKAREVDQLMSAATACGARGISLIPRNDGYGLGNGERQANLRIALRELKPMLDALGLVGFLEPLVFEHCSLQYKSEAVEIIEALNAQHCIKLVTPENIGDFLQ